MTNRKVKVMQHVRTFVAPNMYQIESELNNYLELYDVTIVNTSIASDGQTCSALVTFVENQ